MKKNITRILLWILCIGSLTAMSSHASPAASAEIPLLNHPHPRLLLFKGEEEGIKQMIASHPEWQKMHNLILRECDVLLQGPDLERKLQGANMLKVSREMWKRAFYLSYAYRMTGDKRYSKKVERDMLTVSKFSDWNPQHCLDGAEMTMGVAFGYDWLYDELSESSRKLIREAIAEKGMRHALEDNRYNWWRKVGGNANQVCNSGLGIGAIAVYEDYPELSKKLIEQAFTSLPVALKTLAPDGIFPEGYGYWNYGMTYNVFFLSAIEKLGGTDRGLLSMPGVLRSADFAKHSITPTRSNFNWADQNEWIIINPSMFWLAQKIGDPSVLWSEKIFLEHPTFNGYQNLRELPAIMIWARNTRLNQITEPKEKFWMGQGSNPIAMMRSSWKGRDAIYLGFKAGTPFEIHGHMDVGSFIMEADGYRWASDPGTHNYWLTDSLGINTQSKDPNTQRWIVFRYNNHSHNVITVNGQLQKHKGYAKIDEYSDREEFMYAISDLTDAYNGEVKKGVRGVALKDGKYVVIRDEIETLDNGKPTTIRWKMLSYCDVQLAERSATLNPTKALEKNRKITGKKLTMKVSSSTDIKMKQWSTATGKPYDLPMPGSVLVGFECTIPAGTKATFEVLLIPEKSTDLATFLHKDLSEWKTINSHTPPAVVPVSKLTLDKQTLKLSKSETATLKAIVEPANATNKNVTWSSDKSSIATVDASGRVTAKTAGVAVITVKSKADPKKQATCTVTVTEPAQLAVSPANIRLKPEKDKQKIKITSNRPWKASSSVGWLTLSAASGTGSGSIIVTATPNPSEKHPRTSKVTITAEGLTQTVTFTQKARPTHIKVSKLTLDRQTLKLSKDETTTLKAIVEPANATNKNVTWRSNAPGIASVNNGHVTAVAAGVATISAQTVDGGLRATCQVTVTDETTGNTEILTPQVHAVPGAVRIFLPYPETAYIFSLDALRIHVLILRAGEHVHPLPPGAYAVKIRKESYKILIRNR